MKKFVTTSLAAAGLSIAMLAAVPGFAEPPMGPRHGPGDMLEHMAKTLDLSDEQKSKIQSILEQGKEAGAADRERMQELRDSLRASEGSFNASEVKATADQIGKLTSSMTYRRAETRYQVRQVLTDEQRTELDEMMAKRQDGMRHHGKRDSRPGGPDEE